MNAEQPSAAANQPPPANHATPTVSRRASLVEATLVVMLWSMTPPLAKVVMTFLPPLQFLGARYMLAFLVLLPLVLHRTWPTLRRLPPGAWLRLALMGVLAYPLANGLQFWALTRLSATAGTFTMNFVPLFALLLGVISLAERPTRLQLLGVLMALLGALVFFGVAITPDELLALAASTFGSLVLAINVVMARAFARSGQVDSVSLTAVPLGVGGLILILFAPPNLALPGHVLAVIAFLGVVSGALAYTIWNHALRGLQAFEISLLGNLIPMGTALAAPLILSEFVSARMWLGMSIALVGVLLVSLRPDFRPVEQTESKTP
jgi:drug/metabolite transporter (DMT)-like permease